MDPATLLTSCCLLVPPAGLPITLHGRPIEPVPNVWTLQEPAVEPDENDDESISSGPPTRTWILAGAFWGCVYGIAAATSSSDEGRGELCFLNGLFFAGIGAGAGALVKLIRQNESDDE